jgi:hypothetical protein
MFVNRIKLRSPILSGTTNLTVNVPVNQNPWFAGQEDIIKRDFIDFEVENSINETFDYEKTRLIPKSNGNICDNIIYDVKILDPNSNSQSYLSTTYWSDLGFNSDDFNLNKNGFKKSFLRLDFYDSDIGSSQRLVSFVTLFPKFLLSDYQSNGLVPEPNNYPFKFVLGNSLIDRTENGEGFFLYHFKDEILPTVPKELYMSATFNNAKTGKSFRLMSDSNPNNTIDNIAKTTIGTTDKNKIYTRYLLKRDANGYYYEIDSSYSNNVTTGNIYTVKLYQISAV